MTKRYKCRVQVGIDAFGEPIIKWATGATREQMEARAAELVDAYQKSADDVRRSQSIVFGQYATNWFRVYKVGPAAIKPTTLSGYRSALNVHVLPVWGNRILKSIKPHEIQEWVNSLAGMRSGTVDSILLVTRQIFAQAYADGTIERNPMTGIRKPRTIEIDRTEVPQEHLEALANAARRLLPSQTALLFFIPFMTGLRRGEVLGLTWADVDFQSQVLHVRREVVYAGGYTHIYDLAHVGDSLKTEAAHRDVPIPSALRAILVSCHQFGSEPLIRGTRSGSWISESSYRRIWNSLLKEAGLDMLPPDQRITPHRLRHTYSSITRRARLDIKERQYVMGHADPEITDGRYTHINAHDKVEIISKLDVAFGNICDIL